MSGIITSLDSPAMVRMIRSLDRRGPMDLYSWAREAGVAFITAKNYSRQLHAQEHIHITEYRKNIGTKPTAIFAWGPGVDAKRPPKWEAPKCLSQKVDVQEEQKARRRLAKVDPLTAALMGLHV